MSFTINKTEKLDGDNCLKEKLESNILTTGINIECMYTDGTEIMEGQFKDTAEEILSEMISLSVERSIARGVTTMMGAQPSYKEGSQSA